MNSLNLVSKTDPNHKDEYDEYEIEAEPIIPVKQSDKTESDDMKDKQKVIEICQILLAFNTWNNSLKRMVMFESFFGHRL